MLKTKLPLRITFIAANDTCRWGGSEYCWGRAAERLAQMGAEVRVSKRLWAEPVKEIEHLREAGCHIFYRHFPLPHFPIRVIRKFTHYDPFLAHLKEVTAGADLVVISQGWHIDGLQWLEATRSLGRKYCVICQGVAERWWPGDEKVDRLAAAWEGTAAAFFVSEANLQMTRLMFATPLPRAKVIRNPFNVRYDASVPWPSEDEPLSLAFVSRIDPFGKGHDLLIQALSLPYWRARKIRVSLFGSGYNERSVRRMIQMARIESIQFAGFTEDIERIWKDHHALILPTRAEGMPLVLVEAMLCGRPAIITDVGGARELVRDNINGFLLKAPTVEFLDEAMNRAWENRHRFREIGEQAAIDVRKIIPPDPTEDFVRELLTLAGSSEKVTERLTNAVEVRT